MSKIVFSQRRETTGSTEKDFLSDLSSLGPSLKIGATTAIFQFLGNKPTDIALLKMADSTDARTGIPILKKYHEMPSISNPS